MNNINIPPSYNIYAPQQWDSRAYVIDTSTVKNQFKDPLKSLKKKVKRLRTVFTNGQLKVLENYYNRCKYINAKFRQELASFLKISEKTIKIWFQNRRMKERREMQEIQQESDMNNVQSQNYVTYAAPVVVPQSYDSNFKLEPNWNNEEAVTVCHDYAPVNHDIYPEYYAQCNTGNSYYYGNMTQNHYHINHGSEYHTQYMSYEPSAPDYEEVINL